MPSTDVTAPPARGENARHPAAIPGKGYLEILLRVIQRVVKDQLSLLSAGIAFYGMLALFPALAALVALGGVFVDPSQIVTQLETFLTALPDAAREIVQGQIVELATADGDALSIAALIALAVAIYSASKGMANLIAGLNVAYEEVEKRNFFILQLQVLALTVFMLFVGLFAIAALAVLPLVVDFIFISRTLSDLALVLRWPLLILIASTAFTIVYRFGPSRRHAKWRWIAPGSLMAVLLWVTATLGFAWYVQAFGAYSDTFGTLAGVIVLLMWLWLSAFSILLGATIDAEMEAQTARDSTVGEDRPMGQRGAVKADSCVAGERDAE
jgi:membrane protein